jgi:hypothetical protein
MSSIASTLYSVNSNLLSEIGNDLSTTQVASSSSTSGNASTTAAASSSSDSVNFSQVAQLFQQLQQLETSNPADFQKVTADAAAQLQKAAQQTTDPGQASFLASLADRFQQASQSGNLSAFEGGPKASSGHHGHHHHGSSSSQHTSSADYALAPLLSDTTSQSSSSSSQNSN